VTFAAGLRAAVLVLALAAWPRGAAASSGADELVREAHALEAAHDEDKALRRYTEAIAMDATCEGGYLGLASLRMRLGDPREAERVYSLGLIHLPGLNSALLGRARARRASGKNEEAAHDLEAFAAKEGDPRALRELARWYGEDNAPSRQLAVWRRILSWAHTREDTSMATEARTMVRALQIVLGPIDPVASPIDPTPVRLTIAKIARRGG
jgi:tetratricopeptide (TPR) repeat protein